MCGGTQEGVGSAGGDELFIPNGLQPSLLHGAGLIMQEAGRLCVNQLIASLGILHPAVLFLREQVADFQSLYPLRGWRQREQWDFSRSSGDKPKPGTLYFPCGRK